MNEPKAHEPAAAAGGDRSAASLIAFLACTCIWGSTFLVISVGNDTVPPLWAATLRLALAAALLALIARVRGVAWPKRAGLLAASLYGLFSFGIGFTLLYWAEARAPSGLAAVFYATIPLTTTLLAAAYGLERITRLKVGAAAVAFAGVVVIFSGALSGAVPAAALVALLVAATCGSVSSITLKRGPRYSPLTVNAVAAAVGCLFCATASVLAREPHVIPRSSAQVFPIVYLAVAGSIGAFVLYTWLVHRWDVTRLSFISVVVPVVAMTLGAAFRHERLTLASGAGSALVLAGVLLRAASDRAAAAR